jgi:cytoskeleton protein RodZ
MPESIGQRLKQEREARFITLEKAAAATRIRIVFLQALESNDYSVMPSAAQGRGFLRNYAEYLDLNIDEMLAEIQANPPAELSGPLEKVNMVETDIPPLTNVQEEKSALTFLSSLFTRRPKTESLPEEITTEPLQDESPAPVLEAGVEKSNLRINKNDEPVNEEASRLARDVSEPNENVTEFVTEDQSPSIASDEQEVRDGSRPGLVSRLASLFRIRVTKPDIQSTPEADAIQPVIETQVKKIPSPQPAAKIFSEIGAQLRARRELISLTLDEVERHTKLRAVLLKALEEGALDKLSSSVQTRGMLVNYATFLNLDTDAILLRFADYLQAQRFEKFSETPREKIQTQVVPSMPLLRSFLAGDFIFGIVMIILLAALAIWGVGHVISSQNKQIAAATAPPIVDVLGGTSLPTSTVDATSVFVNDVSLGTPEAPNSSNPVGAATSAGSANVVVNIFAVERVFVRVSADGKVSYEGRLTPHETKVFEADNQVVVLTGNAAAIRITYNGRDLGLMGNVGQVVNRVYLISGVATPTATAAPTATITPLVTASPTPSNTPTVTATPTAGG